MPGDDPERERRGLEASNGPGQTGLLLAALEDGRERTLRELGTVTQPMLAWQPPAPLPGIGQLLYHLALIEADYLLADILALREEDWPPAILEAFPIDVRDEAGRLSAAPDEALEQALERLASVRARLRAELATMTDDDLHVFRAQPEYDVTPAWALHHLVQHEAEHRSHIAMARDLYLAAHRAGD